MLRNPAYIGKACFGKTEDANRVGGTYSTAAPAGGGYSNRCGANQEQPNKEWIEIGVPALITEVQFAFAQERLETNKRFSQRRTIEPSLLQSMLVCERAAGLRPVSNFDPHQQAETVLLPLSRFGRMAAPQWSCLQQSACSPRSPGSSCLDGDCQITGGSSPHRR